MKYVYDYRYSEYVLQPDDVQCIDSKGRIIKQGAAILLSYEQLDDLKRKADKIANRVSNSRY